MVIGQHTLFFAKTVLVWVTRTRGGGSQKATNDKEGEGGGHDTPQNWWCHLWTGPNTVFFPGILHLFWHSSKASGLILNALPNFYVIVQCTLKFFVPECKIALFPFFNTFLAPCCIFFVICCMPPKLCCLPESKMAFFTFQLLQPCSEASGLI